MSMSYTNGKIQVTWDNNYTEEQINTVKKNVLRFYPKAEFFTIVTGPESSRLILTHHDLIVIDNLYRRVNYEISQLSE